MTQLTRDTIDTIVAVGVLLIFAGWVVFSMRRRF
jgi:hypothetical protein